MHAARPISRRQALLGMACASGALALPRLAHARQTAAGWTFEALHGFTWDQGSRAVGSPTFGTNGMLYGIHAAGGEQGLGTLYRWSPEDGSFAVVQNFAYSDSGPSAPESGLVMGHDGMLWGTSSFGGAEFRGTIYTMDPYEQVEMRCEFLADSNLFSPQGSLVEGKPGVFYGTTRASVFRFNAGTGKLKELHRFNNDTDGSGCESALVFGPDGRLWGTNPFGGAGNKGTLFRMNTDGSGFEVVKALDHPWDGSGPGGSLLLASDGHFYGITSGGGAFSRGVAYRLTAQGKFTTLHHFAGGDNDGAYPRCALVEGPDGVLYGTTVEGGHAPQSYGTVFRMSRKGKVTLIHRFDGTGAGGATPVGALRLGADGWLYGTNQSGGVGNAGVLYRLQPA
ncbi:choice-of-anchor tandem repeat GloVer-containing protein [Ideonella sp. YS5]|uniref:choice-of-anchor tandem repeat GloVer-containing protein n=1 Tax=Ideonella sp. YS5 TaxID=3453714 RepID=UPI003EEA460F